MTTPQRPAQRSAEPLAAHVCCQSLGGPGRRPVEGRREEVRVVLPRSRATTDRHALPHPQGPRGSAGGAARGGTEAVTMRRWQPQPVCLSEVAGELADPRGALDLTVGYAIGKREDRFRAALFSRRIRDATSSPEASFRSIAMPCASTALRGARPIPGTELGHYAPSAFNGADDACSAPQPSWRSWPRAGRPRCPGRLAACDGRGSDRRPVPAGPADVARPGGVPAA